MHVAFILLVVIGWGYFGFCKRPFDLLSLAYASATIYFMPGLVGYTNLPIGSGETWAETALLPEAYVAFCLVMGAILLAAWLVDRAQPESEGLAVWVIDVPSLWVLWAALLMGYLGFAMTLMQQGTALNLPKEEFMSGLSRWYLLGSECGIMASLLAFALKQWAYFGLALILITFDMYLGFRTSAAITGLGIALLWFREQTPERLFQRHWKAILFSLPAGYSLFFFKQISVLIKVGNWDLLWDYLADPEFYLFAITRSEPFGTQTILNETLRNGFTVGPAHLFQALASVVPFYPVIGGEVTTFNSLFQQRLFPGTDYGMANNIWAQMWSSGAWPLLVVSAIVFASLLAWGARLIKVQKSPVLLAFAIHFWVYWAFYIHRNDLVFQLYIQRRTLSYWGLTILVAMLVQAGLKRLSVSGPVPHTKETSNP